MPSPATNPPADDGGTAAFRDHAEFVSQHAEIAAASSEARGQWREDIQEVVERLAVFDLDEGAAERDRVVGTMEQRAREVEADVSPSTIGQTVAAGKRLAPRVRAAKNRGELDEDLLADAFGVASWAIGLERNQIPSPAQAGLLSGSDIRFVVEFFVPVAQVVGMGA